MVFWRNRSEKKAETPVIVEDEATAQATAARADASEQPDNTSTNVVTLVTSRLADRLAGVGGGDRAEASESIEAKPPRVPKDSTAIKPVDQPHVFGQKRAVAKIRAALSLRRGEHLLILGEPGTGRVNLAQALAAEVEREAAPDWIYVIEPKTPSRAKAYPVPAGEGAQLRRQARAAIDKASAAFDRHLKSEEYRISLDLLEEETRYLSEKAVEQVRRRAESQNIAVVKSLDGYVLAPMHEGRVVRSDVFRALPEALKRNVEAKITALEDELQSIVATLPNAEFEASAKHEALVRQTALRAIRPSLASLKEACADHASALTAIDAVEEAFMAFAASASGRSGSAAPIMLDFAGADDVPERRKVITAQRISASDLLGEIGRDGLGRPTLLPGHLMQAGSGFVIVEAWRLAADPAAWAALSGALASKEIAPVAGAGVAVRADPLPLDATVILIADDQSWSKLEAIEPGLVRHFTHVAKLAATVPVAELSEGEFAKGAARLAADHGLKPLDPAAGPLIYKDAVRRGGGRVSLGRVPLLRLLSEADALARGSSASHIRAAEIDQALLRRAEAGVP